MKIRLVGEKRWINVPKEFIPEDTDRIIEDFMDNYVDPYIGQYKVQIDYGRKKRTYIVKVYLEPNYFIKPMRKYSL